MEARTTDIRDVLNYHPGQLEVRDIELIAKVLTPSAKNPSPELARWLLNVAEVEAVRRQALKLDGDIPEPVMPVLSYRAWSDADLGGALIQLAVWSGMTGDYPAVAELLRQTNFTIACWAASRLGGRA